MTRALSGCGGPVIEGDLSLANLIKKIGKGPKLSLDLDFVEARAAMRQILAGTAHPAQVGAFLVALRMKGEVAAELAGVTGALRENSRLLEHAFPTLLELAPAHDGKSKTPVLSPFVALLLAKAGLPVVVSGAQNVPTKKGLTPRVVLELLGHRPAATPAAVLERIRDAGLAYYDTADFCPGLEQLKSVRDLLGLRTPLNSVEKIINPSNATHLSTGVFHGPYLAEIAEACRRLSYANVLCLQATEASTDMPLKKRTLCRLVRGADLSDQFEINPDEFGLKREEESACLPAEALVEAVKTATREKSGWYWTALTFNAAVQLWFTGLAKDIAQGLVVARDVAASGLV